MRDADAVEAAVTSVGIQAGLHYLINNAGALWWKGIEETPMERYDLINGINSRAAFATTRAALPFMRAQGFGHIVMQSPPIRLDNLRNKTGKCAMPPLVGAVSPPTVAAVATNNQ